MTLPELRQSLIQSVESRIDKNTYSQNSELRLKVYENPKGFGDCSSTMYMTYKKISGISIGGNSSAQAQSNLGIIVDVATGECPDESNLVPGDLIFFNYEKAKKESDNWENWEHRYLHVGHVEMYIGNGKMIGHPSGIGPRITDMKTYCEEMYRSGRTYCIAKRFIYNPTTYDKSFTGTISGFRNWVKALQKEIGAQIDGIAGPEVLRKLPDIKPGMRDNIVTLVQRRLIDLGYDIGKYGKNHDGIDGIYGRKCQEAVKSLGNWLLFQELSTSAVIGLKEWKFLLNLA